ncbi:MAG: flagellar hook protein FlgE [Armatimonadetes bacterium]|nr:flagellar hook protein FlgE [Armatimonadota bacterium]
MSRALYAGLSGTLANQTRLDVIANNLANVNTVGYKERRVEFADCFYQTLQAGRGAEQGLGMNPVQVGAGVRVASVSVLHSQGAIEATGQPLDAAIEGPGFFVVSDGSRSYLTRDGAFTLDSTGKIVMSSTGMKVLGWVADTDGEVDPQGPVSDISVPIGLVRPAKATTTAWVMGNLDAGADVGAQAYCTRLVHDSLGMEHVLQVTFQKTGVNTWSVQASCEGSNATGTLQFDSSGELTSGGALSLSVVLANGAETPQTISLDLNTLTQRGAASSPVIGRQDGFGTASLQEVVIEQGGTVQGRFSDGSNMVLAQIATANVPNVGGLEALPKNLFVTTLASGHMDIGMPGTGNRGEIVAQSLELSTVDITRAFVDLITTQRGFQANTRVISTAHRLLDDVIQILR